MRVLAVLLLATLLLGCRGENAARAAVERADRTRVFADAVEVHRRTAFRRYDALPPQEWPASFRHFEPKRVSVSDHGVFLVTHERFVESAGIFIRVDPSYDPPRSGDPGFEQIEGEFFWFYAPG